jgi:glucosylceramidase
MCKKRVVSAWLFLLVAVPLFAQSAYLRSSTNSNRWVDGGTVAGATWATQSNYITIDTATKYQQVMGWGGTIQEKHWEAIKVLSNAGKDSINRALFDTSGCNISVLRLSIGCSDFDINENPISLNETAGDYAMNNFSIRRDSLRKIPLIKMATAINPAIRFWSSPWSPPRWMHDNGDYQSGWMKTDNNTFTAYALYLEKYVLAYKAAGINVEWICCQNEPTINTGGYPKCGWKNTDEVNFYKNFMIPRFTQSNLSTRIILGVNCCETYEKWIQPFMADQTIRNFVGVTSHSYQTDALNWATRSYTDYPGIPFFQTEAPFGPYPDVGPQNWARGQDLFNNVADWMNNKAAVYTLWNMVNDETAKSGWDWAQTVAIQVNKTTKAVTYNPWYYAYKHFCNNVKPGAYVVRNTRAGNDIGKYSTFRNPNGDIILVITNTTASSFQHTVRVGNMMWRPTLPANSFNTLRIATGIQTAARERKVATTVVPDMGKARISNSTLYFSLPDAVGAQEMNITLSDLQGRTVWTGHRSGSAMGNQTQVITIQLAHGGLRAGTYLVTIHIKNVAGGKISTVENKVLVN